MVATSACEVESARVDIGWSVGATTFFRGTGRRASIREVGLGSSAAGLCEYGHGLRLQVSASGQRSEAKSP